MIGQTVLDIGVRRETAKTLKLGVLKDDPSKENVVVEQIPNVWDIGWKKWEDDDLETLTGMIQDGKLQGLTLGMAAYYIVLQWRTKLANDRREELKEGPEKARERAEREAKLVGLFERFRSGDAGAEAEIKAMLAK